jgi:hypothetical protein
MYFDKWCLEIAEEASYCLGLSAHVVVDKNRWYFLLYVHLIAFKFLYNQYKISNQ